MDSNAHTIERHALLAALDELGAYFGTEPRYAVTPVHAQGYEPGGGCYDPYTDTKLARLVAAGLGHPLHARVRQAVEDLSSADVEVLRMATAERGEGTYPRVAAQLPEALAHGAKIAERLAMAEHLATLHAWHRYRRTGGVTAAMAILEAERTHRPRVEWRDAQRAALVGVREGEIDDRGQSAAMVEAAVGRYLAAKVAITTSRRTRREANERLRQDLLDRLTGERVAKELARVDARLRRAS